MSKEVPFKVRWLSGGVPDHWQIVEPRRIFKLVKEPERPGDIHLTPSQKYGVLPQEEYMKITGARVVQNLSGTQMQHVEPGDFISHLRTFQGGLELATMPGKVSPAYTVLRPTEAVYPGFFKHVLKSPGYISQIASVTDQLRDGQTMRYNEFNLTWLPLPPLDEQKKIADELDRELTEIDEFIADQQRLKILLKERLDASIEYEMWNQNFDLIPLKYIASVLPGFAFKSSDFSDDANHVPLLRGINVGVNSLKWDDTVYLDRSIAAAYQHYQLQKDDLVLGLDRPVISSGVRVAKINESEVGSLLVQRVARIRTYSSTTIPDWVQLALSSSRFMAYLEPIFTGVSVPHMSPDQLSNFQIPLPSYTHQKNILNQLFSINSIHKSIYQDIDLSTTALSQKINFLSLKN